MKKYISRIIAAALSVMLLWACQENDSISSGGGTPVVRYVRPCNVATSDSLLSGAFLGSKIAIIGESLGGVNKIYFNDQKASLNPNLVTDNAIIVSIPTGIPALKADLIKLYTNNDSCYYTFETKVPAPTVKAMSCEYVATGDVAHIEGLYFVNDENTPLTVTFSGDVQGEIVSSNINSIDVVVPDGAESGPITVTSVYGEAKSSLWFRDNRNIIANFNPNNYPDYDYFFGWHGASGVADVNGINGHYLIINGEGKELTDDTWDDGFLSWEKWTYLPTDPDFFNVDKLDSYVCKFEAKVSGDWSSKALQVIFTGANDVMLNWQNGNGLTYNPQYGSANGYVSDAGYPRGLWIPWATTDDKKFKTEDWITVTIPMNEFKFGPNGESLSPKGAGHYSGLTLFLNKGGVTGTPCNTTIWIDNVRVVPN